MYEVDGWMVMCEGWRGGGPVMWEDGGVVVCRNDGFCVMYAGMDGWNGW